MGERISLEQVERKARFINQDYGFDIEIEKVGSSYRAACNKGSKNLTPLLDKKTLWMALDVLEEGLFTYQKRQKEVKS
jgi:hypothetical protein